MNVFFSWLTKCDINTIIGCLSLIIAALAWCNTHLTELRLKEKETKKNLSNDLMFFYALESEYEHLIKQNDAYITQNANNIKRKMRERIEKNYKITTFYAPSEVKKINKRN